ncbi:MAG TPA: hypothetical protein GX511_01825 [Firmicutes bacterium]|nr:hypothetical protein [Bacillota bacterium]
MESEELAAAIKGVLRVGDTIGFEADAAKNPAHRYRIIGTTGNIVKFFDDQGQFHLLSFAQLAAFAAENRLLLNGVPYTPQR